MMNALKTILLVLLLTVNASAAIQLTTVADIVNNSKQDARGVYWLEPGIFEISSTIDVGVYNIGIGKGTTLLVDTIDTQKFTANGGILAGGILRVKATSVAAGADAMYIDQIDFSIKDGLATFEAKGNVGNATALSIMGKNFDISNSVTIMKGVGDSAFITGTGVYVNNGNVAINDSRIFADGRDSGYGFWMQNVGTKKLTVNNSVITANGIGMGVGVQAANSEINNSMMSVFGSGNSSAGFKSSQLITNNTNIMANAANNGRGIDTSSFEMNGGILTLSREDNNLNTYSVSASNLKLNQATVNVIFDENKNYGTIYSLISAQIDNSKLNLIIKDSAKYDKNDLLGNIRVISGGVNGTFDYDKSLFFSYTLDQVGWVEYQNLQRSHILSDYFSEGNLGKVASAFDNIYGAAGGTVAGYSQEMVDYISYVDTLSSLPQIKAALAALTPEGTVALVNSAMTRDTMIRNDLLFHMNIAEGTYKKNRVKNPANNLWVNPLYYTGTYENTIKTDDKGFGMNVGVSTSHHDTYILGGALYYVGGEMKNDSTEITYNSVGLTLAGSINYSTLYVDGGFGYSYQMNDQTRTVVADDHVAKYNNHTYSGFLGISRDFHVVHDLTVTPRGHFNTIFMTTDKYEEDGGSSALTVSSGEATSLTFNIGTDIDYVIGYGFSTKGFLSGAYEFLNPAMNVDVKTVGLPTSYKTKGEDADKVTGTIGAGINYKLDKSIADSEFGLFYSGVFSENNLMHQVGFSAELAF